MSSQSLAAGCIIFGGKRAGDTLDWREKGPFLMFSIWKLVCISLRNISYCQLIKFTLKILLFANKKDLKTHPLLIINVIVISSTRHRHQKQEQEKVTALALGHAEGLGLDVAFGGGLVDFGGSDADDVVAGVGFSGGGREADVALLDGHDYIWYFEASSPTLIRIQFQKYLQRVK